MMNNTVRAFVLALTVAGFVSSASAHSTKSTTTVQHSIDSAKTVGTITGCRPSTCQVD